MVADSTMTPREEDISKMLKCNTHLGTKNCDVLMEPYVYKRRYDGTIPDFLLQQTQPRFSIIERLETVKL